MLYITTRNDCDAFTAPRTLPHDTAADGGYYVPFRLPAFENTQIKELADKSFAQNAADLLNLFFTMGIESWDIDFHIGRNPVKLNAISNKIFTAETWHNTKYDYAFLAQQLNSRLSAENSSVSDWAKVAIRISVIFGIFGLLNQQGALGSENTVDFAVSTADYTDLIAVWYARKMGLPIGSIICACAEDDPLWDFMHKGELSARSLTLSSKKGIERLLHCTLGCAAVRKFSACCENNSLFTVTDEELQYICDGLYASVVSSKRADTIIGSVYNKDGYLLGADTVMPYGALQDHRAKTGENKSTLIFTDIKQT